MNLPVKRECIKNFIYFEGSYTDSANCLKYFLSYLFCCPEKLQIDACPDGMIQVPGCLDPGPDVLMQVHGYSYAVSDGENRYYQQNLWAIILPVSTFHFWVDLFFKWVKFQSSAKSPSLYALFLEGSPYILY